MSVIEVLALELWQEREMQFEPRLRRMNPDAIDMATGAWAACMFKAINNWRAGEGVREGVRKMAWAEKHLKEENDRLLALNADLLAALQFLLQTVSHPWESEEFIRATAMAGAAIAKAAGEQRDETG